MDAQQWAVAAQARRNCPWQYRGGFLTLPPTLPHLVRCQVGLFLKLEGVKKMKLVRLTPTAILAAMLFGIPASLFFWHGTKYGFAAMDELWGPRF